MAFMIVKVAQALAGLILLAVISFGFYKLITALLRGLTPGITTSKKRGKRK